MGQDKPSRHFTLCTGYGLTASQLQRVIRTGRTGHWLNHTKEHMLVGVKTVTDVSGALKFPSWVNRGLDTDVIVSEVRETSRKPDEVYGMIERMCPGGRKVEIFGRKHNTRPGYVSLAFITVFLMSREAG